MMPGRLSILFMILIALLSSEGSMARDGGGHEGRSGGGRGDGFGGEHRSGFSGDRGSRFGDAHVGESRKGHVGAPRRHDPGRAGFFIESPYSQPNFYYWPYYSFEPYYSSPSIIIPSRPPAYIDQGTVLNIQSFGPNSWDYCSSPAGYYPYVQECSAGWQRIEPQPIEQQPGYWYYCTDPPGYYPYVRECSAVWRNVVP